MKSWIKAAISNSPAMNTIMIAILVVGLGSLVVMKREVFPDFELDIILVSVPYPGASPEEVEEGICQKIEEAVQRIEGIKKMTSVAAENAGSVVIELNGDVKDTQKVVSEVRSQVDRIPSFPELAEDAEVQMITRFFPAINVAVMSPPDKPVDLLELRSVAERVRDQLLQLTNVSQVQVKDAPKYQIDIEIDERTLRKYGLSLQQVAELVRRENLEVPGGTIKGDGQEILLRGENKRLIGDRIAELPLVRQPGGTVLTIGEVGNVRDEFTDTSWSSEINGTPALVLEVQRTKNEDLLKLAAQVRDFVAKNELPAGYTMTTWGDQSVDVQGRLSLLIENGIMGLILVFLVLAIFLDLRLAFWVALGIPISLLGAGGILMALDQSLNMLSMFAFLMALGIIVDDAIVVGENVFAHRQMGKTPMQAAIDGTAEVLPSVTTSVLTTIIAFSPMLFVVGIMGKFISVMPVAVVAMLVISLFESLFILPCHLAHTDSLVFQAMRFFLYPFRFVVILFEKINRYMTKWLDRMIEHRYQPLLRFLLKHRWSTAAAACSALLCAIGFVGSGIVPFNVMPKLDTNLIQASVAFPDGTPQIHAERSTLRMAKAIEQVELELGGEKGSLIKTLYRRVGNGVSEANQGGGMLSGSHVGVIEAELVGSEERDVTSQQISAAWRKATGGIAGADSINYSSRSFGPGGTPIEFKLLASTDQIESLEACVELCKEKLGTYPAVFDIDDDSRPGKWEYRVRVREDAESLGVTTADIAETLRASYYGQEVMRLQRGRHEVKLMVRYPEEDRRELANFEKIWVRTANGERPLTEIAEVDVVRGYSEINRLDQKRSITVSADIDEVSGNASEVARDLRENFLPGLLKQFDGVQVRWEGQQEQTQESLTSLFTATTVALLVMFVLLTLEFQAYIQPLLIMMIIPFGLIGAVLGHYVMGLPLTLFSFFGLVALTGVVVNDSIVLIDFINGRVRGENALTIDDALVEAGARRFRPVMLTSLTTIAGLLPILLERSFQAQLLIPMATSISFGLLLTTVLVLLLVPTFYRLYVEVVGWTQHIVTPVEEESHEAEPQRGMIS